MNSTMNELFKTDKPIIGCLHLMALPGTPHYSSSVTIKEHVSRLKREAKILIDSGFDGAIFANEGDRPYVFEAGPEIVATYVRIVTEVIQELTIPYGCGVLIDPKATMAVAKAIDAKFLRTYFCGTYADTFGFHHFNPGELYRYRKLIGAEEIKLFQYFEAHAGTPLDTRKVEEIIDGALPVLEPDVILTSGPRAGLPPELDKVVALKKRHPTVPIFVANGADSHNVQDILAVSDGIIIGTSIKRDGILWNEISPERARNLIKAAKG